MSSEIKSLEELGAKIATALGDGPSEEQLLVQRRDFLAELKERPRASRFHWAVGGAAAAAIVAIALGMIFKIGNTGEGISFTVGTDNSPGVLGQWVRAENRSSLPIRFDGGSEVSLSKDGAARVIESTTDTVRIGLATGKVRCSINGNHKTAWQVEAGPYTVRVTGTIFTTSWSPKGSNLDVMVERGSVLVTGANLNEHGIKLAVGDHLKVDGVKNLIAVNPETPSEPEAEGAGKSDETGAALENEATSEAAASSGSVLLDGDNGKVGDREQSFGSSRSSKKGRPSSSKKAESSYNPENDLDKVLAEGDVEELWQIAMQARYNKNGGTAKTVLLTIRERFKDSKRAETAAFLIGRVMSELLGNPSSAAEWFRRYLSETPNGPLVEEALGRLFDAYDRAGRRDLANKYASEYLAAYPSGLFADSARQVLNN